MTVLCPSCRFNELRRFEMPAGHPVEDRGCQQHSMAFPAAEYCPIYQREPGSDDA